MHGSEHTCGQPKKLANEKWTGGEDLCDMYVLTSSFHVL
jgi:hypothetical protein